MFTPILKLEHADSRGEIYSITLPDDKELMLLHSKKGTLRGGHSHDVDEVVVLLTGRMLYYKDGIDGHFEMLIGGEASCNPAWLIHMGEFLEDTWLIEQKLAKKGEWKNIDHAEWRERVKANAAKTNG